jgi:hypothetical protein
MFLSGQLDLGHIHLQFGVEGMQAMILPLILVLLGILAWTMPVHRVFYGVIALILSIYSLIGVNLGGFMVGMLLGIVGSVMTVSWLPREAGAEPATETAASTEPHAGAAAPAHGPANAPETVGVDGLFARTDDPAITQDLTPVARSFAVRPSTGSASADATVDEPSAPRPFLRAPAETGAAPTSTSPTSAPTTAPARHRLRRTSSAIGIGLLASSLSTGLATSGAIPDRASSASAAASGGVLCVLDPLHLVCPADDASPAAGPTASPTATSTTAPAESPDPDPGTTPGATGDPTTGPSAEAGGTPSAAPGATPDDGSPASGGTTTPPADGAGATSDDNAPANDPTPNPGPTPTPTAGANPYAPGATPGPKLKTTSGLPVAPSCTAHLSGSQFEITSSWYVGNVTLTRADGTTVTAMKFTADKAVVPDFRLEVPIDASGTHGLLATSDSITMKGHVVLYATTFSGKLLGIPLTFTPDSPPPSIIPLPSMTDVKIEMVSNSADSLAYDNPHQSLY